MPVGICFDIVDVQYNPVIIHYKRGGNMVRHNIKFSLRALKRQSGYVFINVLGLAIGIACALIIALFIIYELSFDRYNPHRNEIYRVALHGMMSGQELRMAYTAGPVGPAMADEFPEVEDFLRMHIWDETIIQVEDRFFTEPHFSLADSSFFDFFPVTLLKGNPETALTEPFSVVLTQTAAQRLFGDEDPMDKLLHAGRMSAPFRVTGVMEDIPNNTHFSVGMVGSFTSSERANDNNWLANNFYTYVKLHPDAEPESVNERFEDLVLRYIGPQVRQIIGISVEEFIRSGNSYNFFLQPLTNIRHNPSIENYHKPAKDPKYLWIFGAIGLLILTIASINFMNLSTAQSSKRAKEVGMKKVIGSSRKMLIGQFLAETIILAFLALLIALLIVEISLPYFNNLLSLNLSLSYLGKWYVIPGILVLTILVGLFAGSYPAFYLSSFSPNAVLKGKTGNGMQNKRLRLALTFMQFVISIMLISGSVIMYRQLNYMQNMELGFDKENILVIRRAYVLGGQVNAFKTELQGIPGVLSVSSSTSVPGRSDNFSGYGIRGRQDESFMMHTNWVDYDYLETFGIQMADGRFFDPDLVTDQQAGIVNERAVRNYMQGNPFETRIVMPGTVQTEIPVIGIVEDHHFESLHHDISPMLLLFKHDEVHWGYVSIRYQEGMSKRILDQAEDTWASFTANEPMLYFFMDDDFNRLYVEDRQNAYLSIIFTLIAVLIASMGLYGLTAFSLQQRVKEIGIRRTFGASVTNIWYMICKDVMLLVAASTVVAWPLIYWVASNWLQNYHYRISMQPGDFLLGFVVAVMIALLTISYRVIHSASVNPAESMRYE